MSTPSSQERPATAFSLIRPLPKSISKQVEEAQAAGSAAADTVADLQKVTWRSRRFVLESQLYKQRSKGRRSWIANDGYYLAELNPDDTIRGIVWCCLLCDQRGKPQFFVAQSTSSSLEHLRKEHSITEDPASDNISSSVLDLQQAAARKLLAVW
jgi:hypothetical protein